MCQSHFERVDLYAVLGIPASATASEVRSAYRQTALRTHPDKGGSAESFHLAALAFEVLSCPVSRSAYNLQKCCKGCVNAAGQCFAPTSSSGKDGRGIKRASPDAKEFFEGTLPKHAHHDHSKSRNTKPWQHRLEEALFRLQTVLQSMEAHARRLAIPKLPARVRFALLKVMESSPKPFLPLPPCKLRSKSSSAPSMNQKQGGLRRICGVAKTKYQACIRIRALRVSTNEHFEIEPAVEHQLILAQLRHEIATETKARPDLWFNPGELYDKCKIVLLQYGVTEESLNLRVFLEFRASPWCSSRCTISSPTFSTLLEALQLNAQLLRSQTTSWEAMRSIWIRLLMTNRRGQPKQMCFWEAAAYADAARQGALQQQMEQAIHAVDSALVLHKRKTIEAHRARKKQALRQRELFWKERRRKAR